MPATSAREIPTASLNGGSGVVPALGALWSNRRILLVDSGTSAVTVLDSTGRTLRTIGSTGDGPGEFRDLTSIDVLDDSTFGVYDATLMRYTAFRADGRVVRVKQFPFAPLRYAFSARGRAAFVRVPSHVGTPSASAPASTSSLVFFDDSARIVDSVANIGIGRDRPMGPIVMTAWVGTSLLVGTGEGPIVSVYHGRDSVRRIALPLAPRPVTDTLYGMVIDSIYLGRFGRSPLAARFRAQLRAIPHPAVAPYYRGIAGGDSGAAWLLLSWPGDSAVTYEEVHVRDGSATPVVFPAGTRVLDIRDSRALTVRTDSAEADHVIIFRVPR